MVSCELAPQNARPAPANGRSTPAGLRGLEALCDADPHLQSAQAILGPFSKSFAAASAVLLKEAGDHWQCVAASDQQMVRLRWEQGVFFDGVAAGRICEKDDSHELPEWSE